MPNDFEQLQIKIVELERKLASIENPATVSPAVVDAITEKVLTNFVISDTGASANDQAVDEAVVATYNVMSEPDGFFTINGKDVPYFD